MEIKLNTLEREYVFLVNITNVCSVPLDGAFFHLFRKKKVRKHKDQECTFLGLHAILPLNFVGFWISRTNGDTNTIIRYLKVMNYKTLMSFKLFNTMFPLLLF